MHNGVDYRTLNPSILTTIAVIFALWYRIQTIRWELRISEGCCSAEVKPGALWMIRSVWSYLCCRTEETRDAGLPTSGWVKHSPIFNKHTCILICIQARVSRQVQVSAHMHLLQKQHLWRRRGCLAAPDRRFPFKAALFLLSHAVTFAG